MKILLLDMDGVLLEAHGYHKALQDTVSILAHSLGYPNATLTKSDIAVFESVGITSEWDSAAICIALMLVKAWKVDPSRALPSSFSLKAGSSLDLETPNYQRFAYVLGQENMKALHPLEYAEGLLLSTEDNHTPWQQQTIQDVLRKARQIEGSITHRIFQELILGSETFANTYNLPPFFEIESYLLQYDRPTLDGTAHYELITWLDNPKHRAVIFTNRPSNAPSGVFSTPEAEIGARLVGIETIPIAGLGGFIWLSKHRAQGTQRFVKPSPVHALTALRLALGDPFEKALETAAIFALDDHVDQSWHDLNEAHVYVFEDSPGGLVSSSSTMSLLEMKNIRVDISLYGVTDNQKKHQALEETGAIVHPTLYEALKHAQVIRGG